MTSAKESWIVFAPCRWPDPRAERRTLSDVVYNAGILVVLMLSGLPSDGESTAASGVSRRVGCSCSSHS